MSSQSVSMEAFTATWLNLSSPLLSLILHQGWGRNKGVPQNEPLLCSWSSTAIQPCACMSPYLSTYQLAHLQLCFSFVFFLCYETYDFIYSASVNLQQQSQAVVHLVNLQYLSSKHQGACTNACYHLLVVFSLREVDCIRTDYFSSIEIIWTLQRVLVWICSKVVFMYLIQTAAWKYNMWMHVTLWWKSNM